ncbi:type II toxin-antitoxin system VapC family toxin [Akkermansiaceae bacterium]|nr:type II toxin-antitoxin system VapC family toxin [Akkermansiaceae bacterium]
MILDTNALSAWADGQGSIEYPLRSASKLVIPSIVLGEYYFGIRQSRHRDRYEEWLRTYLPMVQVASATHATAQVYAEIWLELKKEGTAIPSNDTWIAALARQHQLPLLSNDRHFDQVAKVQRVHF